VSLRRGASAKHAAMLWVWKSRQVPEVTQSSQSSCRVLAHSPQARYVCDDWRALQVVRWWRAGLHTDWAAQLGKEKRRDSAQWQAANCHVCVRNSCPCIRITGIQWLVARGWACVSTLVRVREAPLDDTRTEILGNGNQECILSKNGECLRPRLPVSSPPKCRAKMRARTVANFENTLDITRY
jgi:hypothetical protein